MGTSRSSGRTTSLDELLAAADADTLRELVRKLCHDQPDVELECLDFLRGRLPTTSRQAKEAAGHAVMLLWCEIEPYVTRDIWGKDEDQACALLTDLAERLRNEQIPRVVRRHILDDGVTYVENSALVETLYEVLYASCYDADDLRYLAWSLEGLGSEWAFEHARLIYRSLGDRDKYLELRARKMVYGTDYFDLASFYAECGETDRALAVAKEGLEKGQGRKDDLRQFLSEQALRTGNRQSYLELQFQQAVDRITVESYQTFQHLCTDSEWAHWEPLVLAVVVRARPEERLKLHLLRGEVEQAIAILSSLAYPRHYDDSAVLEAAASLEKLFPEQVLAFYRMGVGDVTSAQQRNEYTRKAKVLLKMRRIWMEIMGQPAAWVKFARNIKVVNWRRPALQEEFGRVIPDWKSL